MKILITGASGFIGSFLCEEGLKRGMETWAGMREHSSRRWLTDKRLKFATLDMTDAIRLKEQLSAYQQEVGRWDVIIHAAGATKCLKREDFDLHNFQCTKNLVNTLKDLDMMPDQFLYVSSLSVLGPIREELNADGTYTFYEGALSSYMGSGTWQVYDNAVYMTEGEGGFDLSFMFGAEENALVYLAAGSDAFPYVKVKDEERFTRH